MNHIEESGTRKVVTHPRILVVSLSLPAPAGYHDCCSNLNADVDTQVLNITALSDELIPSVVLSGPSKLG